MSKIKFCALGGLGEIGKNMYVVNVDEYIFILDAGLKYPSAEFHGIDAIIPDINYLIERRERICGLFLSHGHEDNVGAVVELLRHLNIPVFATNFTISIVELMLKEANLDIEKYRLYRINDDRVLNFNVATVSFFNVTHSVPQSIGISINTNDGSIVYAPDFTFNASNNDQFETSFDKITDISKNKTLALLAESVGCNNYNRIDNDYKFNIAVNDLLKHKNRIVFAMFSSDINRIQQVIDLCIADNRKIAIIGRKTQKTVNAAMKYGYMKIPAKNLVNLKFRTEDNLNDDDNLAIILAGIRHEPYFMLIRMMTDLDKLVALTANDTVCIISPPVLGTERIATKTMDMIYRLGCKVKSLGKDIIKSNHADSEDLKMMYQLLSPKYIIPVIGEYRHQHQHRKVALEFGYTDEQIVMLDNGQEITFLNGRLQSTKNKIKVGDVLIDGTIVGDIGETILKDRQMLSESGAVLIACTIDSRNKEIVSYPKVGSKGFLPSTVVGEIARKLEDKALQIVEKYLEKENIIIEELEKRIKETISKEIIDETNKTPVVIATVIDKFEE